MSALLDLWPVLVAVGLPAVQGGMNIREEFWRDESPDHFARDLHFLVEGPVVSEIQEVFAQDWTFTTDRVLIRALRIATQRGIDVEVLVPEEGNLALVQWASTAQLDQVLEKGVRVFASPPPFDHSKLMIVDGVWVLLGSASWDPKSLQLNFEFNVECYDRPLGQRMEALFAERRSRARRITLPDVRGPLPVKLRDASARLFSPYL